MAPFICNERRFPEAIHEELTREWVVANHFRLSLLADFRDYLFRFPFPAELRQQQENPRQPFFTEMEKLVNLLLLDWCVATLSPP